MTLKVYPMNGQIPKIFQILDGYYPNLKVEELWKI